MESPIRKMLKRNDYNRHKLFRKIRRRRKSNVKQQQVVAEKELKKRLRFTPPSFDDGKDDEYLDWIQQLAAKKAKEWDVDEDAALEMMLNDNTYRYEEFFDKYPELAEEALIADKDAHFPDWAKTVYHPTFSTDSKWNNIVSDENPYGIEGGIWNGDYEYIFSPDQIYNNWDIDRTRQYLDGSGVKISMPKFEDGKNNEHKLSQYVEWWFPGYTDYFYSPTYKQRLTTMYGNHSNQKFNTNEKMLKMFRAHKTSDPNITAGYKDYGDDNLSKNVSIYNPANMGHLSYIMANPLEATIAHEALGHGLNRDSELWKLSSPYLQRLFKMKRGVYGKYKNTTDGSQDAIKHDTSLNEQIPFIKEAQEDMLRSGIWDYRTGTPVTIEQWNKYKQLNPKGRLVNYADDENAMWLLDNTAMINDNKDQDVYYADNGKNAKLRFEDGKPSLIYRTVNGSFVDDNDNPVEKIGWDEEGRYLFRGQDGRIGRSTLPSEGVVVKPSSWQEELTDEAWVNSSKPNANMKHLIENDSDINDYWQEQVVPRFRQMHPFSLYTPMFVQNALSQSSPEAYYEDWKKYVDKNGNISRRIRGGYNQNKFTDINTLPPSLNALWDYLKGDGSYTRYNSRLKIDRPTIIHETTHNYRQGHIGKMLDNKYGYKSIRNVNNGLNSGYSNKEGKLLDAYDFKYYSKDAEDEGRRSDTPNYSNFVEQGTSNTELRYNMWKELKTKLKRNPSVEELNRYIDKYDAEQLIDLMSGQNSYVDEALKRKSKLNRTLRKQYIKGIKRALKEVAQNNVQRDDLPMYT